MGLGKGADVSSAGQRGRSAEGIGEGAAALRGEAGGDYRQGLLAELAKGLLRCLGLRCVLADLGERPLCHWGLRRKRGETQEILLQSCGVHHPEGTGKRA